MANSKLENIKALDEAREKKKKQQQKDPFSPLLPYFISNNQIFWDKPTKEGPIPVPLANFTAKITGEEIQDDGAEQLMWFKVAGKLNNGQDLPEDKIPAEKFFSMTWPTALWGNRPIIYAGMGTKDHLRAAIQLLSGEVPRRTVYLHTGWRKINNQWFYLHGGGAIGADGSAEDVCVSLDDLPGFVLPTPPDKAVIKGDVEAALGLLDLAPLEIMVPLLAGVFRSPLGEAVSNNFSIFLAGKTGAKKSTLTAVMQSFFGASFDYKNLPGNWESTKNALESQVFHAKDMLFVIDDFCPKGTQSDVARLHREADRLLRGAGNQSGRRRMRPDGTLRAEYYPRALIMTSGEDIPAGHSLRARLFILELQQGDVDLEKLTEAQGQAEDGVFARVMAAYLQWLAGRMDELKEALPKRQRELRAKARESGILSHDRVPETVAALAIGWEKFLDFSLEIAAIDEEQKREFFENAWLYLTRAANKQGDYLEGEDPIKRFLSLLSASFTSGHAHLRDHMTGQEPREAGLFGWQRNGGYWEARGDAIGWTDGKDLFLEPEAAFRVIKKFAAEQGESLPITQRTLWKRMAEGGLLESCRTGKNTAYRTIQGRRRHVIHLSASLLSQVADITKNPESKTTEGIKEQIFSGVI